MKTAFALLLLFVVLGWGSLDLLRAEVIPVRAKQGMAVAVSPAGTDTGLSILKQGGNAVDAAVAMAFAMAVTWPEAGNIGGGGFMLVYPPRGEPLVIEYRETAPAAATATMFAKDKNHYGHRVVGVPGMVRGMEMAQQRFGKLPWKTLVEPAVKLARDGFIMDRATAVSLNKVLKDGKDFPELQRVFARPNGGEWKAGDRLVQPELADTLQQIAEHGPNAFYQGSIADKLAAEMKAGGGLITREDLAGYRATAREPIHGTFRGYDVFGPPPPSSGGIGLVEMLRILENFDLKKEGRWSPRTVHLMIEAMKRSYCDRARHIGDPAFLSRSPLQLIDASYCNMLAKSIPLDKATPSETLAKDIELSAESDSTTHFSVIDKDGMAVANTYTLEHSYGSRVVVKGAGFLLNNEMLDFNPRPGYTDRKGTIGTPPNLVAPGKRMLSSQTPTVVTKDGKLVLVTGSPGGRTIINTSLCVVLNMLEFDMGPAEAVKSPRLHHQWFPDQVQLERSAEFPELVKSLKALGHTVVDGKRQGDAHSIWVDGKTGEYVGVADDRISGKASGY